MKCPLREAGKQSAGSSTGLGLGVVLVSFPVWKTVPIADGDESSSFYLSLCSNLSFGALNNSFGVKID